MRTFRLLLGGDEFDTGRYDYFPYADSLLLDPGSTKDALVSLKNGPAGRGPRKHVFGRYCIGQGEDSRKAIKCAHRAFGVFRNTNPKFRRKIFRDMYEILRQKKEDLIDLLIVEGHPRKLAEWEFEGMITGSAPETIDFYFRNIRNEIGRDRSEIVYWSRKPDGVVCLNPPRNAAASNSYNAILALITGNTLVVKPPLKTPISTIFLWKEVVWEALKRNGAPEGVVNIVVGNSQKIMDTWLESPLVRDIIYFGNSDKGLEVGRQVYAAGKKPILELSGNDLFLVWKDADIDGASTSLLDCFMGSTQICMVPKIALIHNAVYDKFVSAFLPKVKALKFGLPSDADTVFSPVGRIPEFYDFLRDAVDKGARIIHGGKRVDFRGEPDEKGQYLEPTLIEVNNTEDFKKMKCCSEEIFFPLLPLVRTTGADDEVFEKMAGLAGAHEYGLRMSLWISSFKYLRKFAKELDNTGYLRINTRHIGFSKYLSTHGGTRRSGGPFGEMNYFWQKTSHLQGISREMNV